MNIKPLPFLTIFLYLNASASPIVDIENIRQSGEAGKLKNVAFALSGSRGNEDRDNLNLSLAFVNNSESTERLFVFEKSKRTTNDVVEQESSFLHARLLKQLENKTYDIETYIQNSENPFKR